MLILFIENSRDTFAPIYIDTTRLKSQPLVGTGISFK